MHSFTDKRGENVFWTPDVVNLLLCSRGLVFLVLVRDTLPSRRRIITLHLVSSDIPSHKASGTVDTGPLVGDERVHSKMVKVQLYLKISETSENGSLEDL